MLQCQLSLINCSTLKNKNKKSELEGIRFFIIVVHLMIVSTEFDKFGHMYVMLYSLYKDDTKWIRKLCVLPSGWYGLVIFAMCVIGVEMRLEVMVGHSVFSWFSFCWYQLRYIYPCYKSKYRNCFPLPKLPYWWTFISHKLSLYSYYVVVVFRSREHENCGPQPGCVRAHVESELWSFLLGEISKETSFPFLWEGKVAMSYFNTRIFFYQAEDLIFPH